MKNEPDTDFDLLQNQEWVRNIFAKWKKSPDDTPEIIPLQIGAETVVCEKRHRYMDRCQDDEVCVCEMSQANSEQVKQIIDIAEKDPAGWRNTTLEQRHRIMYDAANRLAEMRGDLMSCMCAVTGKTVVEGDVEVSEGVDYALLHHLHEAFCRTGRRRYYTEGVILVISPWNFLRHSHRRNRSRAGRRQHGDTETRHRGRSCGMDICQSLLGCRCAEETLQVVI